MLDASGRLVALPGLVDLHTHLREPGGEDAETVATGTRCAARGGFTAVHPMANTDPVADTAGVVEQVARLGREAGWCDVHPVGAVTVGLGGERLAELGAMADSAARVRVFSDDGRCVSDALLMRRALEYVRAFDGVVAQHAQEPRLTEGSQMHEGVVSARLGLAGWPSVAEEAVIARDALLAQHVRGRLHVCHVSTAGAVEVVRAAKARGVDVTCEVTPHHLLLTDDLAEDYDPVFKVNPPLRTPADVAALREAVADGTVDCVATDHAPHPREAKETEWGVAPPGMLGLETALGGRGGDAGGPWPSGLGGRGGAALARARPHRAAGRAGPAAHARGARHPVPRGPGRRLGRRPGRLREPVAQPALRRAAAARPGRGDLPEGAGHAPARRDRAGRRGPRRRPLAGGRRRRERGRVTAALAGLGALLAQNPFGEPAPPQWTRRVPLTLLVVGVIVLVTWLFARGYSRRAASQADLPAPPDPPAHPGPDVLPPLPVRYLGTALSGQWLERVAAHGLGLPSVGRARLVDAGVVVEREGAAPLLLAAEALVGARLERGFLGKVVGEGGVLVVTWRLGGRLLDTGLRAEDRDAHPAWADAVDALVAAGAA